MGALDEKEELTRKRRVSATRRMDNR